MRYLSGHYKVQDVGRFDDLLWIIEHCKGLVTAQSVFASALKAGNGLAFKWTPIKGEEG